MAAAPIVDPLLHASAIHDASIDARRQRRVVALIVMVAAVGILVPAGPGWDFANFYDTGDRAAAGQIEDIYHPERAIAGHAPQGSMAYWSPPLSAYFYVPLAALPPLAALAMFKLLGTLAWMTALWLLVLEHLPHAGAAPGATRWATR